MDSPKTGRAPVLIVDDNPANLKVTRVLLDAEGFDVRTSENAEEALKVLQDFSPRVILMDLQMPGMDGFELTRLLKANPKYSTIKIIAVTAYAMKGDRERALASGCDDYVAKPIDTSTLPDIISNHLRVPRILVIEDNPVTRKLLRVAIESEGWEASAAFDEESALTKFEAFQPQLVLTDIMLGDTLGQDLALKLRALPGGDSVPFIALSGLSNLMDRVMMSECFVDFLLKPVEPSRLISIIRPYVLPQVKGLRRDLRALVIDDNQVQTRLTKLQFEANGFIVFTAQNDKEALEQVNACKPNVIICDVVMPGMDGFTLCRILRSHPDSTSIPVVLATAFSLDKTERQRAIDVGASALVTKSPSNEEAIEAVIRAIHSQVPPAPKLSNAYESSVDPTKIFQKLESESSLRRTLSQKCAALSTRVKLLSRLCEDLIESRDLKKSLSEILAISLDAVGLSRGAIYLSPSGSLSNAFFEGIGFLKGSILASTTLKNTAAELFEKVKSRDLRTIPHENLDSEWSRDVLLAFRAARVHIFPLVSQGEHFGVLVFCLQDGEVYSMEHNTFFSSLTSQLSQAISLVHSFEKLTKSETYYRTLINGVQCGILVLDKHSKIVHGNDEALRLLDRPLKDIVDLNFSSLLTTDALRQIPEVLSLVQKQKTTTTVDQIALISKPQNKIVDIQISPIVGAEKATIMISMTDSAQRSSLKQQLARSQKLEALGRLTGGIAHDFNNMISVMMGYAELGANRLNTTDPLVKDFNRIISAGDHAIGLTRQLLAFSRKQILEPIIVEPNQVLSSLINLLWRIIGDHIDVQFKKTEVERAIKIDLGQFEQVIVNLAINARDAMPNGGTLTISSSIESLTQIELSRTELRPGEYLVIDITDDGHGIPDSILENIFDPFFTTKDKLGTGLGLATVHGIVIQSGGEISVESEVDIGTTFTIRLPTTDEPIVNKQELDLSETHVGSETILLIEDEILLLQLVQRVLQHAGYRVCAATTAKDAHEIFKNEKIDLMLSDIVMPDIRGNILADQFIEINPKLKILFMTGYLEESLPTRKDTGEMIPILQKPIRSHLLLKKIRGILDNP